MEGADKIYVGIAQHKTRVSAGLLVCSALGSCVAVCLYDLSAKIAGVVHILLPDAESSVRHDNPDKFADTGIITLIAELETLGAARKKLRAKIAGGASLFDFGPWHRKSEDGSSLALASIGEKNINAVRKTLRELGIPIMASAVGGNYGRSVYFNAENGVMLIKSARCGDQSL